MHSIILLFFDIVHIVHYDFVTISGNMLPFCYHFVTSFGNMLPYSYRFW